MMKFIKIILIITMILTLTGCWDKIEIDQRAFVSAVGIDTYKPNNNQDTEEPEKSSRNRYIITYVIPNLDAIGKNAVSDKRRFVLSSIGSNPYQTTRQLSTRLNKVMFFKHMKALVIGEDVARNSEYFKEIMDSVERNFELSRKINVMIAQGTAKDIMKVEPEAEPVTGTFLTEISENVNTARFSPQTLGDILLSLHFDGNAVLPRVVHGENEIKVAGSAIIKDYKLVGWLGELENRSILFLTDRVKGSIVDVIENKAVVPYIITDSSTKKSVKAENEKIIANILIEMEGFAEQYKLDAPKELLDEETIRSIEKKVENQVKKDIEGVIKKLQEEFKVDIIGLGEYISKFKPDLWESVKDDWDEVFTDVVINISVKAKLRRVGMTR
jgi:Ger(x)C family germination protein